VLGPRTTRGGRAYVSIITIIIIVVVVLLILGFFGRGRF
jgi:hypothetical protein